MTDVIARALGLGMGKALGQNVVVENKAGAAGAMGVVDMLTARPDGYRLTLAPVGIFRQPYIQKVAYDPVRDLTYIATFMTYDFILTVPSDSPIQTVQDYVAWAKKNPGQMSYGTPGKFTANHVAMALLEKRRASHSTTHPSREMPRPSTRCRVGTSLPPFLPTASCRRCKRARCVRWPRRPIAAPKPLPMRPPSAKRAMNLMCLRRWVSLGPKGMPLDVVKKLDQAIKTAMQDPAFQQVVRNYGIRTDYRDHQAYAAFAKQAFAQEKDIVQGIGLE